MIGVLIYLDISGAFNHAWWPKILHQFKVKNCPRNMYILLQDYFQNRKVHMNICGETLISTISRGCPQGSANSPGLWNILYDDMLQLDLPNGCNIIAYADDALLLVRLSDMQKVIDVSNEALNILF